MRPRLGGRGASFPVPDLIRDLSCGLPPIPPPTGGGGRNGFKGGVSLGVGDHHRQPFGGDLVDNQGARVKPVEAAQIVGHEVERVNLGPGPNSAPFGNRLCPRGGFAHRVHRP